MKKFEEKWLPFLLLLFAAGSFFIVMASESYWCLLAIVLAFVCGILVTVSKYEKKLTDINNKNSASLKTVQDRLNTVMKEKDQLAAKANETAVKVSNINGSNVVKTSKTKK